MQTFLRRILFPSLLLLFPIPKLLAQQGCYVTNGVPEPRIYYVYQPGSNPQGQFFTGSDYYLINCPSGASATTKRAINLGATSSPTTGCWADKYQGSNFNNAGNYRLNGYLVNYRAVNCPVDDYVHILFIIAGGFGLFAWRRSQQRTLG